GLPAGRRDLSLGGMDPGAARSCRDRRTLSDPAARPRPRAALSRRPRLARLLCILLLEELDAAARGVGGPADPQLPLAAPARDPFGPHDPGHDAARAAAGAAAPGARRRSPMSAVEIGLLYGGATLAALFSGMPIAFALGAVAIVFMAFFMPAASLDSVTQN